ncbi:unnamed protein product [Cyprideis torosa]|uniref:Uncharacterized protein n=1 Tax=Cyprideis torosa TaxID=163714 RepID=A0A7R8ZFX3_9CRUS|nr:unnamed protein product [Cyprideis torosa]CAG0878743.1 unnamed protein product [Cyprideis torosa]
MSIEMPRTASAVIIGGGVIGASVAYHLSKLGWQDVVLIERKQFACGTSWHAAGLIGTMRASDSHAQLCEYSMNLLNELESETGQATGFKRVGSLSIAHSQDRFEELRRVASMNNAFGVTRVDTVTPDEIKTLYPLVKTSDLLGGTWVEQDGTASPTDITTAFIKGARKYGALCLENVLVKDVIDNGTKVTGVNTDSGNIEADFVVNCAGLWARKLGKRSKVNIPLHACEHYYAITEKHSDIKPTLPVLRDHDRCAYYREDAGSLMVGAFEKKAVAWGQDGIPADFCFDELPGHMEQQLMPVLEDAMQRVPLLQELGWRKFFCGPESFTPDDQFHIGESPELRGYFVACGLNSVGIQTSGGLGKALAEWMHKGHSPLDLWSNDIRRMYPFMGTQNFIQERVTETLGLLYENHYPYRQYTTARDVRHSPIHERLEKQNACFGQVAGWERANWFAPKNVKPEYEYSFGKQNWFQYSEAEHNAARSKVALFDQSSFSKYTVQGKDSCKILQKICSADIDVDAGKIVYTHWLNERGGIEADLTVCRLSENDFWITSASATTNKDLDWLKRNTPDDAFCITNDVTSAWAVFGIMGPNSRALLEKLTGSDFSTENFQFGTWQAIEVGSVLGRAFRVSFVGELGWELYFPADMARHAFDRIMAVADEFELSLAGLHALDSCRIEKKFLHYGHDISEVDNPFAAGAGFVCNMNKTPRFNGYDAIARIKDKGAQSGPRLVQFLLQDPNAMLYHHEPIQIEGEIAGYLTSGNYGHTLGGSVGLGYITHPDGVTADLVENARFSIDVGGQIIEAKASLRAMYDPKGERMRS